MKYRLMVALLSSLFALGAQARNTELNLSIEEAMNSSDAKSKLDAGVQYFFSYQKAPALASSLGEDSTSKKTNAFGKSDEASCQWAFLSAMVQLQARAHQLGADAVIDIQSNYDHKAAQDPSKYECHAGALMSGVALKGRFVKLAAGKSADSTSEADKKPVGKKKR